MQQSYLPADLQQPLYVDLQQQQKLQQQLQAQGYLQQAQSPLQQQIQPLPASQQVVQQPLGQTVQQQPAYVNVPVQQQTRPVYAVNQQPVVNQPVFASNYRPVQQQPVMQQHYPGLIQPPQQVPTPLQQQSGYNGNQGQVNSNNNQGLIAGGQGQILGQGQPGGAAQAPQQVLPSVGAHPQPQPQRLSPQQEQYNGTPLDEIRPLQVNRNPGTGFRPAYEARPPMDGRRPDKTPPVAMEKSKGLSRVRPDVGDVPYSKVAGSPQHGGGDSDGGGLSKVKDMPHSKVAGSPQHSGGDSDSGGESKMKDTDMVQHVPHDEAISKTGNEAVKAQVKPVTPADGNKDGDHGNTAQKVDKLTSGSGETKPSAGAPAVADDDNDADDYNEYSNRNKQKEQQQQQQQANNSRQGGRTNNAPSLGQNRYQSGYTGRGSVGGYNSPNKPGRNRQWDTRPPNYKVDYGTYRKPVFGGGYGGGRLYNDYDNYEYADGPDYNYYLSESGIFLVV